MNLLTVCERRQQQKFRCAGHGLSTNLTFNKPAGVNGQYYTVDPINSRWQGQLGVKLNF